MRKNFINLIKLNFNKGKKLLVITFLGINCTVNAQAFVHPGAMHTNKDLDFIKSKIQANQEPWKSSFANLKASSKASLSYNPNPFASVNCGSYNQPNDGCNEILDDPMAAYTMALRWYIERDNQYADKTISILMEWADTYNTSTESNTRLVASAAVTWFVNAAEILRYNYSGWTTTHTNKMNTLFGKLKPHIYWDNSSGYNNWVAMGLEARLSLAVWQNNRTEFDASVDNWKVRIKTYIYQTSDGAKPLNPPSISSGTTEGKWRGVDATNTSYIDGLCMETCRDFNHSKLGVISFMNAAEVAWNQGEDLFVGEKERIKDFYELHSSWLLGTKVPSNICGGTIDWKGTLTTAQEAFDLAYNHLHDRLGMNMPNTFQVIKNKRPNGASRWTKKWETLAYANRSFTTATPPVVTIPEVNFSIKDTIVSQGYSLTLNIDAKDVDGIANVKLYINDVLIRQETNAPYDWGHAGSPNPAELNGLPLGTHQIKAVAIDTKGDIGESFISIEVREKGVYYLTPIHDAYIQAGTTRFNTEDLRIENGNRLSYLKFDLSSFSERNFEGGILTLDVSFDNGNGVVDINLGSNTAWTETNLASTNLPTLQKMLASKNAIFDLETTHDFSLSSFTITGDILTLAISMQAGGNDVSFGSKESTFFNGPKLMLKTGTVTSNYENEIITTFTIYPNPSQNGIFRLSESKSWIVTTISGIEIAKGNSSEVDLSKNTAGIYLLKTEHSFYKLIIK